MDMDVDTGTVNSEKIVILDAGAQYSKLIDRYIYIYLKLASLEVIHWCFLYIISSKYLSSNIHCCLTEQK